MNNFVLQLSFDHKNNVAAFIANNGITQKCKFSQLISAPTQNGWAIAMVKDNYVIQEIWMHNDRIYQKIIISKRKVCDLRFTREYDSHRPRLNFEYDLEYKSES